jgi:hypothetical protein
MHGCGSRFRVTDVRTIPPSSTSRCLDIGSVARSHRRTATVDDATEIQVDGRSQRAVDSDFHPIWSVWNWHWTAPRRVCISQAGWTTNRKCHNPGWTRLTAAAFPDAGSRCDRKQGGGCVLSGSGDWKRTMPLFAVLCRLRASDHSTVDTATFIAYEAGGRMYRDPAMPRVCVNPTCGHWRLMAATPTSACGEWTPCPSGPSSECGLSCG